MTIEAMKQAIELLAVATFHSPELQAKRTEVIERGLQAIAATEESSATQEPVAIVDANDDGYWADILPNRSVKVGQLLYTHPQPAQPKREWVGLTDEDIFSVLGNLQRRYNGPPTEDSRVFFALAIEAKLREKNSGETK